MRERERERERAISVPSKAVQREKVKYLHCMSAERPQSTHRYIYTIKRKKVQEQRTRHCEERSDEAIQTMQSLRWIASLRSQ
jgi:hypothetical protein